VVLEWVVRLFFAFLKSAFAMAGLFFANGAAIILAAEYSDGAATFWSANAVLAFTLLVAQRSQRVAYLFGAAAASVVLNIIAEHTPTEAIANSVANVAEASLVAWALVTANCARSGRVSSRDMLYFAGIAVIASAGSATISVAAVGANHWQAWQSWFASDTLGLLLVFPALWSVHERFFARDKQRHKSIDVKELALVLAVSSLVTLIVFCQSVAPIIFVCTLPVIVSVFRLGAVGAIISTFTIATISIAATLSGYGPIVAWSAEQTHQILLLQGLLASLLMAGLPTAIVLAERNNAADQLFANEMELRKRAEEGRRFSQIAARTATLTMSVDHLTGLASRQRILSKLASSLIHSQRHGSPLSLAIVDVDHFKTINDRFGHAVGDQALKCIGDVARAVLPPGVRVGRIGGEEFLILFPGYEKQAAHKIVEQFRAAVASLSQIVVANGFSVSAGLAGYSADGSSDNLLHAADAALFAAKRGGRNQTLLAA
jgi:diguanylate cyclase